MSEKKREYPANGFRICIDFAGENMKGRALSPLQNEPVEYEGLHDLLLKMDRIFDAAGYPQAFQEKRSFGTRNVVSASYRGKPKTLTDSEKIYEHYGNIATFDILVVSRRNTSWQGIVRKADEESSRRFQGEIELIQILLQEQEDK